MPLGDQELDAATIPALQARMRAGELTAVALSELFLHRITTVDPALRAVLAIDPSALDQARESDRRRSDGRAGPLEGIPVLVKDNIAVTGLPTTAGSLALARSAPADAPLVSRLRAAGAVVLGKANLSEWANLRSSQSTSGWSAVGGQTRNPYAVDRNPSGSSSGSAVAVAASLAQVAIGTETDGSIVSPAGVCGVVGLKPTLGAVPGAGIVPISSRQDTAGPMARWVVDAALVHAVLTGAPPPAPPAADVLVGCRLGVWRQPDVGPPTQQAFDEALDALRSAAATLVDVDAAAVADIFDHETPALLSEFHVELDAYLAAAPDADVRSLAELIAFNEAAADVELAHFGQDLLERALAAPGLDDAGYRDHRRAATGLGRRFVDEAVGQHAVQAIVALTNEPAWPIDYASGDGEGVSSSSPAAVAGYPSITVPGGFVAGLPVGLLFMGPAGTDNRLLDLAAAVERALPARQAPMLRA